MTHSMEKKPFLQTVKLITQSFNLESYAVSSAAILRNRENVMLHTCPLVELYCWAFMQQANTPNVLFRVKWISQNMLDKAKKQQSMS